MKRPAFNPVKPRAIGTVEHCLARLIAQAGGIERVMAKLDVKKSVVYAYTEQNPDGAISYAKVRALSEPGVTAAAEDLALLAGGVFLPIAPEQADLATLCADDARAHGEAVAEMVGDLARGTLKKNALEKIESELRALVGLRAAIVEQIDASRR